MIANQTRDPQDIVKARDAIEQLRRTAEEQAKVPPGVFDKIKAIYAECDKNRSRVSPTYIKDLGMKLGLPMDDDQASRVYENYLAMERFQP